MLSKAVILDLNGLESRNEMKSAGIKIAFLLLPLLLQLLLPLLLLVLPVWPQPKMSTIMTTL